MYLLDSDVFIRASRGYYAFDIAPRFWESLEQLALNGRIQSIDRVLRELNREEDELKRWANEKFIATFVSTDEPNVIHIYGEMMEWVQSHKQFTGAAKAEFADARNADAWLVAYAKAHGLVVITNEVLNTKIKKRVPIPNVCQAFNVLWDNDIAMIRALGIKL